MKLLFLCVANSIRSQIAEGVAKRAFADGTTVQSAGASASRVQPFAVQVLAEIGIDGGRRAETLKIEEFVAMYEALRR